ncbi:MAG: AI-2E family transporter [Vicinamibacteraceae bacterium]
MTSHKNTSGGYMRTTGAHRIGGEAGVTWSLVVLAFAAVIGLLHWLRSVLLPLSLSLLLASALNPAVAGLARRRLPRPFGAALLVGLLLGGSLAGAWALQDEAAEVLDEVPVAAQRLRQAWQKTERDGSSTVRRAQKAAREIERTADAAARQPGESPKETVAVRTRTLGDYLWTGSVTAASGAAQAVLVVLLTYFLLASAPAWRKRLIDVGAGWVGGSGETWRAIVDEVPQQLTRIMVVYIVTGAIVACATATVLWWLGLQNPIVWGIAAGVLNAVPYLGPAAVAIIVSIVAFAQFESAARALWTAGATLAITSLEGWLIMPLWSGRVARLSAVTVFAALLFWTWAWGPWGTFLALPMTTIIKVICDRVPRWHAVGRLLGERMPEEGPPGGA